MIVGWARSTAISANPAVARLQTALYVAEGRRRVGEEHHTHARGREIERAGLEREHLRIPGQQ